MKLTATFFGALALLATPVTAATIDRVSKTGTTSGDISVEVAFEPLGSELFVDDLSYSLLSLLLPLASDGSFDPAETTVSDLQYFPDELMGRLVDVDYSDDMFFALFETTDDATTDQIWGDLVLATLDFGGLVDWSAGLDFAALSAFGDPTSATATLDAVAEMPAPIPLPASLPLMVCGLALGATLRGTRRRPAPSARS